MKKICFTIGIVWALSLHVQAQSRWSNYSYNLAGGRAYSLAGANVASVDESSATFYNPGALGTLTSYSWGISLYAQLQGSSFNTDDEPSHLGSKTIDERRILFRPDFAGLSVPIGKTGITASATYMRLMDWHFKEDWKINSSQIQDETFSFDEKGGLNAFSFGLGKGWDGEFKKGLGSSVHIIRGSEVGVIEQNGSETANYSASYSGVMFRHGFVLRSDEFGLGIVYENPWERRRNSEDELQGDSAYSITNFGQQLSVGFYVGGNSTRWHVQYNWRDTKKQQAFGGPTYSNLSNTISFEGNSLWSLGTSLEFGSPGDGGGKYSFRYTKYPHQLDNKDIHSLMGCFALGGGVGNDLHLDFVIGLEYFPRHLRLSYGNDGELIHKATFWRIGLSLYHLG